MDEARAWGMGIFLASLLQVKIQIAFRLQGTFWSVGETALYALL